MIAFGVILLPKLSCPDCGGPADFWPAPPREVLPGLVTADVWSEHPRRCRDCRRIFLPEMEDPFKLLPEESWA
jgi:hypothetical protein